MENRKVFNHLHVELSVLAGENISRMELWEAVSKFGDPRHLSKEEALNFLDEGFRFLHDFVAHPESVVATNFDRMLESFKKHDFTIETPEEILERISSSFDSSGR